MAKASCCTGGRRFWLCVSALCVRAMVMEVVAAMSAVRGEVSAALAVRGYRSKAGPGGAQGTAHGVVGATDVRRQAALKFALAGGASI